MYYNNALYLVLFASLTLLAIVFRASRWIRVVAVLFLASVLFVHIRFAAHGAAREVMMPPQSTVVATDDRYADGWRDGVQSLHQKTAMLYPRFLVLNLCLALLALFPCVSKTPDDK